jgi:radical SAM superfamily enzyme YgiQ (UPF0313 family)
MSKILFFNPRSANSKPRIPNSILQVAASINNMYEWDFVDGNLETNPQNKILETLNCGDYNFFACSVMPGPQLKQAIVISKQIHDQFPQIKIIWGGYFPSNQYKVVLDSGFIDVVVNGMGDKCFPELIHALQNKLPLTSINNIIFKENNQYIKTPKNEIFDLDKLPAFPYDKLNSIYPLKKYLGKTYLGTETIAYHSSFGCPFTCSFCGIVPIYNARWKGKSAQGIYDDILYLKNNFGGNAIEFHDNNFFVSERRTAEFSKLISKHKMIWWGEGRIDTIDKYKDETLAAMRESGCKMIFFGAETGNDEILKQMDKGGTQTAEQIEKFAARLKKFDIIPEYSFVLGLPAETSQKVMQQIDNDIDFIKRIKRINPTAEIIIYVYSPVPTEGSELFEKVKSTGFNFPQKLEDWISPEWESFDLRKNPLTPWLTAEMVDKIKNFETVLNGYYPTVSDIRLTPLRRKIIRSLSSLRYKLNWYRFPYELKLLQKIWKYRQPEIQGF